MNSSSLPREFCPLLFQKALEMIGKSESIYWANVWWILAADYLTFDEVMGDFRKKKYPLDWFRGRKACKDIPGKNNILHWKRNFPHDVYNAEKILHRYMSGKKFLAPEIWEKILAQNKPNIPPPPQKSNGRPHRGWGRSRRIWHLSRCHPSTKWLAHAHHVVAFKTKVLHLKIEKTPIKDTSGKRRFKRVLRFLFVDKRELFALKFSFEEFNLVFFKADQSAWLVLNQPRQRGTFFTLWS